MNIVIYGLFVYNGQKEKDVFIMAENRGKKEKPKGKIRTAFGKAVEAAKEAADVAADLAGQILFPCPAPTPVPIRK
jgi:hypothetical protein